MSCQREDERLEPIIYSLLKSVGKKSNHIDVVIDYFIKMYQNFECLIHDEDIMVSILKIKEFMGNFNYLMYKYWIAKTRVIDVTFESEVKDLTLNFVSCNSLDTDYEYIKGNGSLLQLNSDEIKKVLHKLSVFIETYDIILNLCNEGNPDSQHYKLQYGSTTRKIYMFSGSQLFTNYVGILDLNSEFIFGSEINSEILIEYYKGLALGYDKYFHFNTDDVYDRDNSIDHPAYTWTVWITDCKAPIIIGSKVKEVTSIINQYEIAKSYFRYERNFETTTEVMISLGITINEDNYDLLLRFDSRFPASGPKLQYLDTYGSVQSEPGIRKKSDADNIKYVFDIDAQRWVSKHTIDKNHLCSPHSFIEPARREQFVNQIEIICMYDYLRS
jgi:hypothetical protein